MRCTSSFVQAFAAGALASLPLANIAEAAPGTITGVNKGNRFNITSIDVYIPPGAGITPPPPWGVAAGDTRQVQGDAGTYKRLTGGSLGQNQTATITTASGNNGKFPSIIGFDYKNAAGNTITVGADPDPVGCRVVEGGITGASYLGYAIPAHQWGYFYTMWNNPDYAGATLDITMNVGKNSGVHNLQVLPFSFSVASLMSITPGDPYQMQHYMEPEDAIAGMGAATSFSYDANSGIATADWSGARDLGLGAGQTSQVCAMTAPFPPTFGAQSGSFTTDPPCPPDMQTFVLAPSEPEPGSAGLMVVGALSVLLHRKRHD